MRKIPCALLTFMACGSPGSTTMSGMADAPVTTADAGAHATTIGVAGGTVMANGGRVTLVIPAGALDRDVDILVTAADVADAVPGTGYELSPSGILFRAPATLRIVYDTSALPPGTDEASLSTAYVHPEGTRLVGPSSVDAAAHSVSAPIIHFTRYGLVSGYLRVDWMEPDDTVGVTVTRSAALERVHVGRTCAPDASGHYDPTCIGCRDDDFAPAPPAGSQNWCLYSGSVPSCVAAPPGTYTDYVRAAGFYCWRATKAADLAQTVEVYSFGVLTPPAAPQAFAATANADGSVSLSWQRVQGVPGDITEYTVLRNGGPIGTLDGTAASYLDAAVQPSTTYTYVLVAVNDAGPSPSAQATVTTAPAQAHPHTLTVQKAGGGGGNVSSSPAGIACGGTCSAAFVDGTAVTLTATPDSASAFSGWSGSCSGSNDTTSVTVSSDLTCTATFDPSSSCGTIHVTQDAQTLYLNVSDTTAGSGSYYWSYSWLTNQPPGGDYHTSIAAPAPGVYTISVFIVGPECETSTTFTVR